MTEAGVWLGPAQTQQTVRQVLAACERSPTDAVELNYDPRNPFDICSLTFTPIYRCAPSLFDGLAQAGAACSSTNMLPLRFTGGLAQAGAA